MEPAAPDPTDELEALRRRAQRERDARLQAEAIAESVLRQNYERQQTLEFLIGEEANVQSTLAVFVFQLDLRAETFAQPIFKVLHVCVRWWRGLLYSSGGIGNGNRLLRLHFSDEVFCRTYAERVLKDTLSREALFRRLFQ